eukprot:1254416-Pyramimonas_sp.AAC.1
MIPRHLLGGGLGALMREAEKSDRLEARQHMTHRQRQAIHKKLHTSGASLPTASFGIGLYPTSPSALRGGKR